MTKKEHLEHARHNTEVCNHLYENTEFNDWVITSAFYSAMHFVLSKIFPINMRDNKNRPFKIKTFDDYCAFMQINSGGKHKETAKLVSIHCSGISADYDHLKSICWTARYSCYNFDEQISKSATDALLSIRKHCDPKT